MCLWLIGFAAGYVTSQMQATLLPVWLPLGVLVLRLLLAAVSWRQLTLFHVLLVVAVIAAGSDWSDWRAQQRMVMAPGPAWGDKDIATIGVVAELSQLGDDATHSLFHIESNNVGGAVSPRVRLSWYGTRTWDNVDEEDAELDRRVSIPDLQPG